MKYEYPNLMLLDLGPKQVVVIVSWWCGVDVGIIYV
jgi:hypothetical protein